MPKCSVTQLCLTLSNPVDCSPPVLLLGNKTDCEEYRQVSTEAGQQLAQVSSWTSGG